MSDSVQAFRVNCPACSSSWMVSGVHGSQMTCSGCGHDFSPLNINSFGNYHHGVVTSDAAGMIRATEPIQSEDYQKIFNAVVDGLGGYTPTQTEISDLIMNFEKQGLCIARKL